jgi:hypothetical protein
MVITSSFGNSTAKCSAAGETLLVVRAVRFGVAGISTVVETLVARRAGDLDELRRMFLFATTARGPFPANKVYLFVYVQTVLL